MRVISKQRAEVVYKALMNGTDIERAKEIMSKFLQEFKEEELDTNGEA